MCLSVWSTTDVPSMSYERKTATGNLIVKYIVQVRSGYKNDIVGRIYCMSQTEMDRMAPSNLVVSKTNVGSDKGTCYSILAEFPLSDLKEGCCVDGVLFFNTVVVECMAE